MKFKEIFSQFLENFIGFFLFLIAFSTLFFLPYNSFVLQTKQYFLIGFALLFLIFWTAWVLINKKFNFIGKKLVYIFPILFLLGALVSSLFSKYKHGSFWGNETWSLSFFSLAAIVVIFLVCINYLKKEKFNKFLFIFLSTIGIAQILLLIFMAVSRIDWMPANLIGQNISMGYMSVLSMIVSSGLLIAYINKKKSWLQKSFLILFTVVSFIVLVAVNSAAVWLLAIIGSLLLAVFTYLRLRRLTIRYFATPAVILILAVVFWSIGGIAFMSDAEKEALPSFSTSYEVVKGSFWDCPLQGVGLNNYSVAYNLYRPIEINQTPYWSNTFYFSYSKFFDLWTTGGLAVILTYLALLIYFSIKSIRALINKKNEFIILPLGTAWLLYVIGNFLFMSNLLIDLFAWFVLAGIIVYTWKPKRKTKISALRSILTIVIASVLLLASVFALGLSVKRFVAAQAFFQVRKYAVDAELQPQVEEWMKFAVRWDSNNDNYHRQLAIFYISGINNLKQIQSAPEYEVQFKNDLQNLIQKANQAAVETIEKNPNSFLNHLMMADFYKANQGISANASEWQEKSLSQALELFPGNVYLINQVAQTQLDQARELTIAKINLAAQEQDTDELDLKITESLYKSQKNAKKALEYKSDYLLAQYTLALVEWELKNNDQAISIMEDLRKKAPNDIGVMFYLALMYDQEEEIEKAIELLKQAIQLAPNFSDSYWMLARIYSRQGEIEKTRQNLEKILEYDPQNQNVLSALESLGKQTLIEPEPSLPEILELNEVEFEEN